MARSAPGERAPGLGAAETAQAQAASEAEVGVAVERYRIRAVLDIEVHVGNERGAVLALRWLESQAQRVGEVMGRQVSWFDHWEVAMDDPEWVGRTFPWRWDDEVEGAVEQRVATG